MDDNSLESARLLNSSVVEERLQAVRLLAGLRPVRMDHFCRAFGDQDWRVRKEAIRFFRSLPDIQRFTAELIELLHDSENAGLRNSSIEILVSLGPLAVADLTASLNCPDPEVRKFIIDILGEIGVSGCEDGVLNALTDDDINVRYAAVETLGKLAVEESVGPLLDLMDAADTGLRFTILEALASIGKNVSIERLSRYLDDRVLRKAVLDCFGRIGGVAVLPFLVEGVADPLRKIRETSLRSLGTLALSLPAEVQEVLAKAPENLTDQLVELLDDSCPDTQRAAIRLAAMVGASAVAHALLPLLKYDNLRDEVITAFRTRGEPFLARLMAEEPAPDPTTRLCLIYLAGELSSEAGLHMSIASLGSSDPQMRYTAAVTLGKIGHAEGIEPLVCQLQDESPDISDAAASALGMFDSQHRETIASVVSPLLALPDAALRMRAVRVLASAESPGVESALLMAMKDPEFEVRCEAIKALRGCRDEAYVEGLKLALNDEVTDVRRLAAEALGACSEEHALPALALAADDQDPWVRAAAVRSLRNFPDQQSNQLLTEITEDPVGLVVIAALETLVDTDPDFARPCLEKALMHPDEEVVKAAIDLLVRDGRGDHLAACVSVLLNHVHRDVRVHTVQTIARLGEKHCQSHMEQRLQIEEEPSVRQVLEETLQHFQRFGG